MLELISVQMMPLFYMLLVVVTVAAVKMGFELSELSPWVALAMFLVGKSLPVVFPQQPELLGLMLSGCAFSLTIGILIGYVPRWLMTQVMPLLGIH